MPKRPENEESSIFFKGFIPILYTLIIVSGVLFVSSPVSLGKMKVGLVWYAIQWILNLMWPVYMFVIRKTIPWVSRLITLSLLVAVSGTIWEFQKISQLSAILLIPYWVFSFFSTIVAQMYQI